MSPKSASFDVLGTCFHFTPAIQAIHTRLGPKLLTAAIDPKTLFFSWFYAAQRDFTYTSLAGRYQPIAQILSHTFRRACLIVDLPADAVTDEDVAFIMATVKELPPREGLKECFDGLRDAGWDVYGVTNGAKQTSLGYYRLAQIELDEEHLLSCDEISVAKPDERVYATVQQHLDKRRKGLGDGNGDENGKTEGEGERWFVAAHAWDLIAAKKAGFKTAYLSFEEHDPVTQVFGEFDLYADSMEELLKKMKKL